MCQIKVHWQIIAGGTNVCCQPKNTNLFLRVKIPFWLQNCSWQSAIKNSRCDVMIMCMIFRVLFFYILSVKVFEFWKILKKKKKKNLIIFAASEICNYFGLLKLASFIVFLIIIIWDFSLFRNLLLC